MIYILKLLLSILLGIIALPIILVAEIILAPFIIIIGAIMGSGFVYFKTIRYLTL